jgi:hypothetical protein
MAPIDTIIFILFLLTLGIVAYWWFVEYIPPENGKPEGFNTPPPLPTPAEQQAGFMGFSESWCACDRLDTIEPSPNAPSDSADSGCARYASNTCNPTQQTLPITFPDPNEGVPPLVMTPEMKLFERIKNGSMSCDCDGNKLNFCQ